MGEAGENREAFARLGPHPDDWLILAPAGCVLPPQGWKIHVSACLDNAGSVLDRVLSYCVPRGLS